VREAGVLGNIVIKDAVRKFAANVLPVIREIQTAGAKSNAAIAAKLMNAMCRLLGVEFGRMFRCGLSLAGARRRHRQNVSDHPQRGHLKRKKSGIPRSL
jgi:hypothetical protein